jgi:hypothetical protein
MRLDVIKAIFKACYEAIGFGITCTLCLTIFCVCLGVAEVYPLSNRQVMLIGKIAFAASACYMFIDSLLTTFQKMRHAEDKSRELELRAELKEEIRREVEEAIAKEHKR